MTGCACTILQEIQQLKQQVVQVEQQLRVVMSPTYLPHDRDKATEDQNVSLTFILVHYYVIRLELDLS